MHGSWLQLLICGFVSKTRAIWLRMPYRLVCARNKEQNFQHEVSAECYPWNLFELKQGDTMVVKILRSIEPREELYGTSDYSYIFEVAPSAQRAWMLGLLLLSEHFPSFWSLVCRYYYLLNTVCCVEKFDGIWKYKVFYGIQVFLAWLPTSNDMYSMGHLKISLQFTEMSMLV